MKGYGGGKGLKNEIVLEEGFIYLELWSEMLQGEKKVLKERMFFIRISPNSKPHDPGPAFQLCQIWLYHERRTTQSSCICPPEKGLLHCLQSSSTLVFSSTSIQNSLCEFCAQNHLKCFPNRWLETSWFSHTVRVFCRSTIAFSKRMLREPSCSINVRCFCSEYEIVPSRF